LSDCLCTDQSKSNKTDKIGNSFNFDRNMHRSIVSNTTEPIPT
jgi:hypothetical protein